MLNHESNLISLNEIEIKKINGGNPAFFAIAFYMAAEIAANAKESWASFKAGFNQALYK